MGENVHVPASQYKHNMQSIRSHLLDCKPDLVSKKSLPNQGFCIKSCKNFVYSTVFRRFNYVFYILLLM
jgi:hypothetical protein